jgi:hypothetical protein
MNYLFGNIACGAAHCRGARGKQLCSSEGSTRWVSLTIKHYVSILKIVICPDDESHVTKRVTTGLRRFRRNSGSPCVTSYRCNANAPFRIVIVPAFRELPSP